MSAIVLKKVKQLVSDGYLTRALEHNKNGLGFAVHDGKEPTIAFERGLGPWDLQTIKGIQETYQDYGVIFNLMNLTDKNKEDDVQPFVILGDEQNPVLVGFAEGDFFNFIASGSDHANEYFLFNKFLIPKIRKLYDSLNGELSFLLKELNDPVTKQDMVNTCGPNGTIVLLANTGETLMFDNNALKREYEWGVVSKHYGYEEATKTSKVMEFLKKKKAEAKVPIIADTKPIEQPIVKKDTPAIVETKPDTAVRPDSGTEWVEFKPGPEISKKKLKKLYRRYNLGTLPSNWEERPIIRYKPSPSLKSLKDLAKAMVVKPKEKPEPAVTDKMLPVLSPKVIESIIADLGEDGEKDLDNNSRQIFKLDEITAYVEEHDDFEEATGINNKTSDMYDVSKVGFLAFKYPMAMLILGLNWRARAIEAENAISRTSQAEIVSDEESKVDTSGTGITKKSKMEEYLAKKRQKIAM